MPPVVPQDRSYPGDALRHTRSGKLRGDNEIRTRDPLLARQVLSQLSYTPGIYGLKWTRTTDLTLIRRAL